MRGCEGIRGTSAQETRGDDLLREQLLCIVDNNFLPLSYLLLRGTWLGRHAVMICCHPSIFGIYLCFTAPFYLCLQQLYIPMIDRASDGNKEREW